MKTLRTWIVLAVTAVFLTLSISPTKAQTGLAFTRFETENDFPRSLTFKTAVSGEVDIVSATLVYHLRNEFSSNSITRVDIEFDPGREVELSYTWDTSAGTIPGAAVVHYWEVVDADGRQLRSHEMTVRYEDTRFDWQVRENDDIAIWWHDRRDSFGEQVFEIAQQAVAEQRQKFQADLDFQMRIMIYNNFDEFAEWNGVTSEFIGGQAFPNQGVTAQIVSAYGSQEQWLNDVVPHEISHLYFAQVTFNRRSQPPTWLNEGLAQFNEFGDQSRSLQTAVAAANSGDLISLSLLETGFGYFNEERTRLAYAEAVSAVTYLVETYGDDGLAALLAPLCRMLRDDVSDAVKDPQSPLVQLAKDWRQLLFPDASDDQFADAYAQ
ncbi:MAG: peptidase MA family metallohydrolase, partial [Anaerolineae bacterium]